MLTAAPSDQVSSLEAELVAERALRRELEERLVEVRRSENYFRHLTEYSLDLITILDATGTIRFESKSIEKELGHPPEDYTGRSAFEFVHPDDAPRVMQAFATALQTHGSTPVLSFRFRHRDGSYRILEGRGNNLLDDEAVEGIVFNSRDVTDQRRLEDQLRHSQKVQAIGQLTGGVAHDFNNILTAILGYGDLALQGLPAGPTHSHVSEMRTAALRAAALTRQLLAFSRKQVLLPRVLSLKSIICDMDKMLRRLLGEQIDLVTLLERPVGNVKADLNQIEQVLLNMAVNARDAMEKVPAARLTIELHDVSFDEATAAGRDEAPPGDYVMLAISDVGCGMTEEVKEHLFEPFFTTKEQGRGTGLGLATCHGIVKQSGGHISVYSEEGHGTTFKIYLPRVEEVAEPVTNHIEPVTISTGSGTILFVEDEPMLRELGITVLQELGYEVIAAENGQEALLLAGQLAGKRIDLILTDVVMPEMGGRELIEKLRPLHPETKVIFCSGYTEDAIFHSGTLDRHFHFLPKPYTVAIIAQKVSDVLSGVAL